MLKRCVSLLIPLTLAGVTGCGTLGPQPRTDPNAAVTARVDPIKDLGTGKAVLSLNMRKAFPDACIYGVTLTNNLRDEIVNITFRFSAYVSGDVFHSYQTKSFFGIKPTEHQYREMTFNQIRCDQIERLAVTDPGRCAVGKSVTRFTTSSPSLP